MVICMQNARFRWTPEPELNFHVNTSAGGGEVQQRLQVGVHGYRINTKSCEVLTIDFCAIVVHWIQRCERRFF